MENPILIPSTAPLQYSFAYRSKHEMRELLKACNNDPQAKDDDSSVPRYNT